MVDQAIEISVGEAHERFGDLAQIRCGKTTWIDVECLEGTWRPVLWDGWFLTGYRLYPLEPVRSA